jgi:hypothetical protein
MKRRAIFGAFALGLALARTAGADPPSPSAEGAKAAQAITFAPVSPKFYLDGDFELRATATSGLPVSFTASGDCAVSGSTAHILGAGKCFLVAHQPGDERFEPAEDVEQRLPIEKSGQRITFPALASRTYLDPDVPLEATTSSRLPIVFVESGPCTVVGSTVRILGAGRCWLSAHQPGDPNFTAATIVDEDFWIAKADQSIRFPGIPDQYYGAPPIPLRATSTSRLPVTYSTSGPCVVVDSVLHMVDGGICTVIAEQRGDANFNPSRAIARSFTIVRVY